MHLKVHKFHITAAHLLSLDKIVSGVDSLTSLKELLELYETSLVAEDLVAAANGLAINFAALFNDYDAAINDVYRHDAAINSVNEAVACFLLLYGKIKEE
ncbi:MAG: hypothetical protein AB8H12_12270 [Lewinella sp.]